MNRVQAGDFRAYIAMENRETPHQDYVAYPSTDEGEVQQLKDMYGDEWHDSIYDNVSDQTEFNEVMNQLFGVRE